MNLKLILRSLNEYYKNAEEAEKIIITCALTAAGASAVGGIIPILAIPSLIISCVGAVWAMYIQLCKCLEIPIRDNILKVLASAALSNIATNLISVFAIEIITTFIPGVGSVANAAVTFACIYLAGLMFMKMILLFAKQGKVGKDFVTISEDDLKSTISKQTPSKEEAKQASTVFKGHYQK